MRKFLLSIFWILIPLYILGQKHNLTNQYVFNPLAINPAFAGNSEALSATLLYRNQWAGIHGAPETMTFAAHSPLRIQKMGLGLSIITDKIGVTQETSIIGNYAHRIKMGDGIFSLGLGAGVIMINTAWSELNAIDKDDELIQSNSPTHLMPDFSLGLYYSTRNFNVGFSLPYFLTHKFNATQDKYIARNDPTKYNYMLNADYLFQIYPNLGVVSGGLIRYNQKEKTEIIATSSVIYREMVSLGAAFDSEQDLMRGIFQLQLNKQLRMGYAFDFNTGKLSRYKSGSHEIMLRYDFKYTINVKSPRTL